jgi:hypothetical protein
VDEADVIVDCAASRFHYDSGARTPFGGGFTSLNEFIGSKREIIGLDWADGGVPPVALGFFREVISILEARGGGKVVFACMGGHGRTGTALAAVLIACKEFTAAEAVEYVRSKHCTKACETEKQLAWLCAAAGAGEKVSDKGFPLHSYASGYGATTTTLPAVPAGTTTTTTTPTPKK